MPDPANFASREDFLEACVPEVLADGTAEDNEQAVAVCISMWENRSAKSARSSMDRAWSVLTIKQIDSDERIIEGVATTPSVDRIGDIVEPKGAEFELPMPLLWQHRSDEPVGHVVAANATDEGINIRAKFARIEEPGQLKDMVDKAWQSVKARLVRGLSIGFQALGEPERLEDGGLRFNSWSWLELSLVTIPANQDATISVVKSIDAKLRAASGHDETRTQQPGPSGSTTRTRPGASGKTVATLKLDKERKRPMAKQTIGEQVAGFEAARQAKAARMAELMDDAAERGETLDEAETEEYDGLEREVEQIDGHLKRLHALERANAAQAKAVNGEGVKTVDGGSAVRGNGPVSVKGPQLPPGVRFARVTKAIGIARGNLVGASQVAESLYPDDAGIQSVLKAAVAAGSTSNTTWAGALVGDETNVFADFVEFLRPMTILGKFGANNIPSLRRVPFRTPLIEQTGGGSGYWVGEGAAKPLTDFAFARSTLDPLKAANIAVVTEELLRDSSPSADVLLRDSLAAALRERLDTDFIDPTKTASAGISPASITNGVTPIASSGTDADAVRVDVKAAFNAFADANHAPTTGVWVMSSKTALSLSLMMNALGQPEFPSVNMNGGTFVGLPVITSEYVPLTSAGSPSVEGGTVVLVDAQSVYFADDGGIAIDMSREASLQMDDSPTQASTAGSPEAPVASTSVSLWQTNSVGFRAERTVNWKLRRASGVQMITSVLWA